MAAPEDLFGRALLAHAEGRAAGPLIIERDDGYLHGAGAEMWLAGGLWPSERAVAGHAIGRVLDIGCGAGRALRHFAALGHDVTGLDVSPAALEVCRRLGAGRLVEADAMALPEELGRFDTVLLFGNNIGIGASPRGVRRLLEGLGAALAPGGRILAVSVDVSRARRPVHVAYASANTAAGRAPGGQRLRIRYAGEVGPWFGWIHPHPRALAATAEVAGLSVAALDTGKDGTYGAVLARPGEGLT